LLAQATRLEIVDGKLSRKVTGEIVDLRVGKARLLRRIRRRGGRYRSRSTVAIGDGAPYDLDLLNRGRFPASPSREAGRTGGCSHSRLTMPFLDPIH